MLQGVIREKLKVKVTYVSAEGHLTKRLISPWRLQLKNGSEYLLADCHLRHEERAFKLTRMKEIEKTSFRVSQSYLKKDRSVEEETRFLRISSKSAREII